MDQVFNTTELVEAILLHLHPKDILLSQRVCRKFQNTIQGSLHLRRALFLAPTPPTTDNAPTHDLELKINPIHKEIIQNNTPVHFKLGSSYHAVRDLNVKPAYPIFKLPAVLNLTHRGIWWYPWPTDRVWEPGSWRDMYLCQSPCVVRIEMCGMRQLIFRKGEEMTMMEILRKVRQALDDGVREGGIVKL